MATTTTIGHTTPQVSRLNTNRAIYWGLLAALAILLVFAFTASRNSTVVTPSAVQSMDTPVAPMSTPVDSSMKSSPSMDANSANSVNSLAPYDEAAPTADVVNPDGLILDPAVMGKGTQEPGTSVSPDAPKGTVVR